MALKKKEISLDLVIGADTKMNPQIDTSFQEMENISFAGDMTAKKVAGKSELKNLKIGTSAEESLNYSILAKSGSNLLALSEAGIYKKLDSDTDMVLINSMGSLGMDVDIQPGEIFAIGDTRKCVAVLSETNFYTFLIYQLDGVLVSRKRIACGFNVDARHKMVAIGDDFYFLGTSPPGGTGFAHIYNCESGIVFADLGIDNFTAPPELLYDMITDGTDIYVARSVDDATISNYLIKVEVLTAIVTLIDLSVSLGTRSNINITNRDASSLWLTYVINSATEFVIRQAIVAKSPFAFTSFSNIGIINKFNAAQTNNARITATAYSDSLAMFVVFERLTFGPSASAFMGHVRQSSMGIATLVPGIVGKGKPFLMENRWYAPLKLDAGTNEVTVLLREGRSGGIDEPISPTLTTLLGRKGSSSTTIGRAPNTVYNESFRLGDSFFFASENSNNSAVIETSIETNQENGAIEIDSSLVTYGSINGLFDGAEFAELGFIGYPQITSMAAAAGGSLPAGEYQAVAIYTWTDIKGNIYRSAESNTSSATIAASDKIQMTVAHPIITKKDLVSVEVYIRKTNSRFQLAYRYEITPALLYSNSFEITTYPGTGEVILYTEPMARDNSTPLNAKCMTIYGDRLFYVSHDDSNLLRFTKQKKKNIGFEFVEDFRMQVLDKSGIIEDGMNCLFPMDGRLLIFKDKSILYTYGAGPADDGSQNDFVEPQLVSTDVGCINQRSLVLMPKGVMFMSQKGIHLIARSMEVSYIGSPVEQFNDLTITSAVLMDAFSEIRFTSKEGTTLVYNYFTEQWSWVTDMPTNASTIYNNKHVSIREDKIVTDDPTTFKLLGDFVTQKIASPWIRLKNIQGYQKAYLLNILGFYKTKHKMKVEVYYDYEKYVSETYEIQPLSENQYNITVRPTDAELESGQESNGVYQLRIDLVRKNCEAVRVVITDIEDDLVNNNGECFALSNLTFTVGVKNGTDKLPAAKSY